MVYDRDIKKAGYFRKLGGRNWFPYIAIAVLLLVFIAPIPFYLEERQYEYYDEEDDEPVPAPAPPPQSPHLEPSSKIAKPQPNSKDEFKVDSKGFWIGLGATQGHIFDTKLATAIIGFFKNENVTTVLELGAGTGQYSRALQANGIFTSCYDGNPNTQELTAGMCGILDLSKPIAIAKHEWVLSLEVGEHIPKEFESMFINNLDSGNHKGMILSWAVEGQTGTGHVNNRNNTHIKSIMDTKGYVADMEAEKLLRSRAKYGWFKGSIMVFRRDILLS